MISMRTSPRITTGQCSNGTRITATIPPQDYDVVLRMAKTKKISASWIVRDTAEKYIQSEASPSSKGMMASKRVGHANE
jgi:hypothetical protein